MSISSEITRLQTAKADIKTAIEDKGVTVPASVKLDDYADYIDNISTGGVVISDATDTAGGTIRTITAQNAVYLESQKTVEQEEYWGKPVTISASTGYDGMESVTITQKKDKAELSDVNFIDYDGTVVYSYTASDFANLTALPPNPTHDGLTSQGWNWTLAEINTQLTQLPGYPVYVGQMYVTTSGDTYLDIDLNGCTGHELSIALTFVLNGTVSLDFGDGSEPTTKTNDSTTQLVGKWHTYAESGCYTITISVESGEFAFSGGGNVWGTITKANSTIGNVNALSSSRLRSVRIGTGITTISEAAFRGSGLQTITIPNNITSIGNYAFYNCANLKAITIPRTSSLSLAYIFYSCDDMRFLLVNPSCNTVTSNLLQSCRKLIGVSFSNSLTTMPSYSGCYNLRHAVFPNTITSISSTTFSNCYSLSTITIPENVTSIATGAFNNCISMTEYHFLPTTPPTLANTNAFTNIPSTCVIYVPYSADGSVLAAYQAATNWSTYASYMQEESQ